MSVHGASLPGWTPFRVAFARPAGACPEPIAPQVDWCHLGEQRLVEPFFSMTVAEAMRSPFNLAFQQRTPIADLAALPPGLPVAGFIFHMSRCGSTLLTQGLAALESNIVVSEPAPLRTVLRAAAAGYARPDEAAAWLRWLVNAYAQPRFPFERRLFVKFMAADVLDIALVRQTFPTVPWVFVTRDPAEILASQARTKGVDLLRGQIPAARLGLTDEAVWQMDGTAYQAQVLAAFGQAALDAHPSGNGLILDYDALPAALWTRVADHVGLRPEPAEIAAIQAVCRRHSKAPGTAFDPLADPNRTGADAFRAAVALAAGPVMAALAALH